MYPGGGDKQADTSTMAAELTEMYKASVDIAGMRNLCKEVGCEQINGLAMTDSSRSARTCDVSLGSGGKEGLPTGTPLTAKGNGGANSPVHGSVAAAGHQDVPAGVFQPGIDR